jgi:hypothetical protein
MKLSKMYKSIIVEQQVLDFEYPEVLRIIQKYIDFYKNNPNLQLTKATVDNPQRLKVDDLEIVVYDVLRNSYNSKVGSHTLLGFTDENFKQWRDYFSKKPFYTDGVWSQYNINPQNKIKVNDRTYNYYITLEKSKENISNFYKNIHVLANDLLELSKSKNNTAISFKTTLRLDSAVTENDNLKVYFYDKSLEDDVEKVVKSWASKSNIKLSNRSHTKGVDIGGQSFGKILSKELAKSLEDTIKKNTDKYTAKQYAKWLETYMPNIVQSIKIK